MGSSPQYVGSFLKKKPSEISLSSGACAVSALFIRVTSVNCKKTVQEMMNTYFLANSKNIT